MPPSTPTPPANDPAAGRSVPVRAILALCLPALAAVLAWQFPVHRPHPHSQLGGLERLGDAIAIIYVATLVSLLFAISSISREQRLRRPMRVLAWIYGALLLATVYPMTAYAFSLLLRAVAFLHHR